MPVPPITDLPGVKSLVKVDPPHGGKLPKSAPPGLQAVMDVLPKSVKNGIMNSLYKWGDTTSPRVDVESGQ